MLSHILVFAVLLGGMALTATAGEPPKSRTPVSKALVQDKFVKLPFSSDRQTRQPEKEHIAKDPKAAYRKAVGSPSSTDTKKLRFARQHILTKWKQSKRKERKEMASELSRIVRDPKNHASRPEAVKEAMIQLGELRSLEGIDVLVEYIGFPKVRHPDAGEYAQLHTPGGKAVHKDAHDLSERLARGFPAIPALINIGPPCIDAVIVKFSKTDNLVEQEICTEVLKGLHDDSIKKKLEEAIPKVPARRRDALQNALEALDKKTAPNK